MITALTYGNGDSKNPIEYENYQGTITNGSNWNLKTTGGKFVLKDRFHNASIRTDAAIAIKINATTSDSISLASTDSPFVITDMTIHNLFITNTGSAAVKIMLW